MLRIIFLIYTFDIFHQTENEVMSNSNIYLDDYKSWYFYADRKKNISKKFILILGTENKLK